MDFSNQDEQFIRHAIEVSKKSVAVGGYPAGAIVVIGDEIVAEGLSDGKNNFDPTMHAEIDAIRKASQKIKKRDLEGAILYSSLEPCVMCFSASFWAHIPKIIYACGRSSVKEEYYTGKHDITSLNEMNLRKMEILHFKQYTDQALQVIEDWEKSR